MNLNKKTKICIIGLGYVGLPLAISFQKYFKVIGYDINSDRIENLKRNIDTTEEVNKNELSKAKSIEFTSNKNDINFVDIFIVTVPTPIFKNKIPGTKSAGSAHSRSKSMANMAHHRVQQSQQQTNAILFDSDRQYGPIQ